MGLLFQQITAAVVVILSVSYLAAHYWKRHKAKTGCPSCKLMQAAQTKPANRVGVPKID